MAKIYKNFLMFILVFTLLFISMFMTACGGTGDGSYTENGLILEVKNHSVNIVGVEDNVEQVQIPVNFNELKIEGIKTGAFQSDSLKKISFEQSTFANFSIYSNAFDQSSVEIIENLPSNVILNQDSFAGLENLKSISVYGEGNLSVENGALIEIDNGTKGLRLLPAGSEPLTNYEEGIYTITGFDIIYSNALSYNKYIKDIVIADDIVRLNSDICTHVKLNSITIQNTDYFDLFIDSGAFTIHKDLKVYVPANTDREMNSWLNYSKNFIYGYNWLVHPVGCNESGAHLHGIKTQVDGSIEGYSYEEGATSINIDVGSYFVTGIKVPNYMFQEYQG